MTVKRSFILHGIYFYEKYIANQSRLILMQSVCEMVSCIYTINI